MTGRRSSLAVALFLLFAVTAQAQLRNTISTDRVVPLIVKLTRGKSPQLVAAALGGTVSDSIPGADTYLVRVPNLPVVAAAVAIRLGIERVEVNRGVSLPRARHAVLQVPLGHSADWYKQQPSLQLIRIGVAQQYSTGRGILLADINSRVDYGHPALVGHLGAGYDFVSNRPTGVATLNDDQSTAGFLDDDQSTAGFLDDDQSTAGFLDGSGISLFDDQSTAGFLDGGSSAHGTFTAGILAVVAPGATIMPLRAFDDNGNTDLFMLAKAIFYAAQNGAQVINMSFGTLTDSGVLKDAIDFALSRSIVLVASAGNNDTWDPQYPAAYPGVIAVASTDLLDRKASFSNYGGHVFVEAPGIHLISAIPNGKYSVASGTSFSAPMVAGMAALIRSLHYSGVATTISGAAISIDARNPAYAGRLGYGRIDLLRAVKP